jgi:hypothetical protein
MEITTMRRAVAFDAQARFTGAGSDNKYEGRPRLSSMATMGTAVVGQVLLQ